MFLLFATLALTTLVAVTRLAEKDWRARRNRNAENAVYSLALALALSLLAFA